MLRLFGIPESEIAETLRVAEGEIDGLDRLEVTTCLRRGEVEVVVRHEPADEAALDQLSDLIAERHADTLFSTDGSSIDDQVAALLDGHDHRHGRVVHRRPARGPPDRAGRVVGLRRRRHRQPTRTGRRRACWAWTRP